MSRRTEAKKVKSRSEVERDVSSLGSVISNPKASLFFVADVQVLLLQLPGMSIAAMHS